MRSVLALVALFALLALGAASAPQQANGDVSLLQLSSQSQSVASLEAELAAAVQQQQRLEAELGAHADSETESEASAEADSGAEADAVAQLEAQIEAQAAAEVEAQQAAGVASSVDAETDAETESTDASSAEAELAAEIDAANAAQAEEAQEAEPAHKALTEVSAEAETEGEPVTLSGSVQDNDSGVPTHSHRRPVRPQGERLVHRLVPGPDPERIAKFRARREVVRSERSHPLAAPDRVELPNGKALHKTWIVSPNLRLEKPAPKPTPIHSRERVMTPQQRDRLATYAEHRDAAYMPSEVRRRFLAQNPQIVLDQLRARSYSPESEWLRAMHRGALRRMRFDPPTPPSPVAVDSPVNGSVAITSNRVSQHVTIRHTPPSIRQRAEMNALRAASRTLRRINAKRREYRRAMRALARARNQVQREMHRHHVERARVARLEAARAARRAAWSALLQHGSLRRELLRSVARTLRRRNLTGAARRRAIARLIRRNLSAEQRAKLHAFIRTSSRANLQPATIASPVAAAAAAAATPAAAATLPAVTPIVSLAAPNGTSNGTQPTNGTSTVAPVPLVASTPSAAAPAAAEVSQKDKAAIEALVERIRAAVASSASTPDAASSVAPATVGVQVGAPVPAASMSRKASATRTMRFLQQKVSAAAAAEASAAASAARLARAEQLASEAEADALTTLSHSELDQQSGHVVLQSDAAAEAAARDADSWIKSHGF